MAKRKRLSPAQDSYLRPGAPAPAEARTPAEGGPPMAPPIAQVAAEAASEGALRELSAALETSRAKGLIVDEIDIAAIDATYLVRDRIDQDEEDMAALMRSLRSRGQQTPIEVVALGPEAAPLTHGLISGWRRLTALRRLQEETGDPQFQRVKALVIRPDSASDAYVAMVEENEIRVNLSHYERARIAVRALREGVYDSQKTALQSLFANAPRAKRSKIGSFVSLVEALDDVLLFPAAIGEKLGLGLVRALKEDPTLSARLRGALQASARPDAEAELAVLADGLKGGARPARADTPPAPPGPGPRIRGLDPADGIGVNERVSLQAVPGVKLGFTPGKQRIELTGDGVDDRLLEDLTAWLRQR